jgi:hypothetical protein
MYKHDRHVSTGFLRSLELHVHLVDGHFTGRELAQ